MARESIEERRARLAPGAAWLTAQRESRGLSGRELARRLGINADRIFAYERAQDEPKKDFVVLLATEYGMEQADVWRGLAKELPDEFADDDALADYWLRRKGPDFFRRAIKRATGEDAQLPGDEPGDKQRQAPVRPNRITRKSEGRGNGSQERASGA